MAERAAQSAGRWWARRVGLWAALLRSAALALSLTLLAGPARAQYNTLPPALKDVDVEDRLGATVPMDVLVTDSTGRSLRLGEYFNRGLRSDNRPAVLALVYYDCPVACPAMLANLTRVLGQVDLLVGRDLNVVVVSFDPTNTPTMASKAREGAIAGYAKLDEGTDEAMVRAGWHFHTTTEAGARAIADAVGFRYKHLPDVDEYAHPTVMFVLTPGGKVSSYLFTFEPAHLEQALLDASGGTIARTIGQKIMAFCYMFDPTTGGPVLRAFRLMQVVGVLTVLAIGVSVGWLLLRERAPRSGKSGRRRSRRAAIRSSVIGPPSIGAPAIGADGGGD